MGEVKVRVCAKGLWLLTRELLGAECREGFSRWAYPSAVWPVAPEPSQALELPTIMDNYR